ncbi:LytR C-terminal domain-containing protein [Arthrobacter sp. B6]|uniref:LytR C-terminal domain-containing protein n=1 Tax=Arthrobacter sp. B6 TaxID=1570137 RepID=UPI00082B619F|nr:LytR C-terminal domain-containing protein [Arthrobacter sp. B6]
MTKYARDEFDRVPETVSRQGVHRAASAPSRPRLWPLLAVGAVALAVGLVSFLILPQLGFTQAGSQASASLESPAQSNAAADPSPSAEPSASAEPSVSVEPSASAEPSQDLEAEPSESPATAAVNKSQGLAVYNAAGTPGLAGRVSSIVQADGWTLGQVGNWGGAPQQTSVIFYAGVAQQANAEALSELLNIPTMVNSAEFQVPLVVVLGPGFQ